MTLIINDVAPRVHYTAAGAQTAFTIPFEYTSIAHIKVYKNGVLMTYDPGGVTNILYDCSVAGVTGGGTITFGAGLAADDIVAIIRDIPVQRTSDFPTSGIFDVGSLNAELDLMTAMIQQNEMNLRKRSLLLSEEDTQETLGRLPSKTARAGYLLAFDTNGDPVASLGDTPALTQALVDAEAFADAASASATSASSSASTATTQASASAASAASVAGFVTDLNAAKAAFEAVGYFGDWGAITEAVGASTDYGAIT